MQPTRLHADQPTDYGASFPLKNRLCRALWQMAYLVFFRFTPPFMHAWRSFILRLFGARIAAACHIYPSVQIWAPWNLRMGHSSCLGRGVEVYNQGLLSIGNCTVVSQNTHLCGGTHDYNQPHFPLIPQPITIQSHVWIAADCFIGGQVVIEEGCVVGARSVVIKNLPAWSICVGHPCLPKKNRPRFYEPASSH